MSVRVYTERGTVAHELRWGDSPNEAGAKALCGRTAWPGYWYGTGTQNEHERAAELPLCVGCKAILVHQAGGR
ncbi:hypothetical protein C6N75_09760 [Streptomyces solincola]|uniref:Uncharacterized protein n=1 Tax=Streptomyces solincola TaxID=2100817 RepID=A0A2S9PY66_9ACTN|nr:hypothetical protein [Streptomyces solincola]PRH79360.1 hypothetical protein C6N75_09760 [Streptomyces solincola]